MPIGINGPVEVAKFQATPRLQPVTYIITGVTYDATGTAVLPNVTVEIFETVSGLQVATCLSDAQGIYTAVVNGQLGTLYQAIGYLAGSPDVAGVTLNMLVAVAA